MVMVSASEKSAEILERRRVSARFAHRDQLDEALRRLLKRRIPKEKVAIMRQYCSKTQIVGFWHKADLIRASALRGALHGIFFGGALTAIAGVTTFTLPLMGSITLDPPRAIALGAMGGACLSAMGVGLGASLLVPELAEGEEPPIYRTLTQPGKLSLVIEVPAERSGEVLLLLQSAGGEDVLSLEVPTANATPLAENLSDATAMTVLP